MPGRGACFAPEKPGSWGLAVPWRAKLVGKGSTQGDWLKKCVLEPFRLRIRLLNCDAEGSRTPKQLFQGDVEKFFQ